MNVKGVRDIGNLHRENILDDYLEITKSRGDALVATALRTKSVDLRDILVHGAVRPLLTSAQLKDKLLAGSLEDSEIIDLHMFSDLGRLVLLQNLLEDDIEYGEALLSQAHTLADPDELSIETRRVFIQHHMLRGDKDTAERLLDRSPDIDAEFHGYLRAETLNPFLTEDGGDYAQWLCNFNRFFTENGLASISFSSDTDPFNNIHAAVDAKSTGHGTDDPLVSVVLTSYRPDNAMLLSSVRSILDQTWAKLELIVVDDCSGDEYENLFREVGSLDHRVKILRAPENRGTYVARNIGYAASSGEFITGQDDDDWAHPERIARQVNFLKARREIVACRTYAIPCNERMGRGRLGNKPVGLNASSLMIRRSMYEFTGAYLESRKAADTEYYLRLKKISGGRVADLKEPLGIIRMRQGSLSREDFSAGWRHPARPSFKSAYRYWHRHASPEHLTVAAGHQPPVRIPDRFSIKSRASPKQLDVVFAGDWQRYGGPQKSMLEEIAALQEAGYRVGVMNLEAARFMYSGASKPLNDEVQNLINKQVIDEVFYDETAHVRLLILRYPPILQFISHEPSRLQVASMIVLANQAPSELDGSDIRYLVEDCQVNARAAFGVVPLWVPQGPQVRDFLSHYLSPPALADFDMPGILNVDAWWHDRLWYRSTLPVVGRHSRDVAMKWPAETDVLKELYPIDGKYDVRIMGGHRTPLRVLSKKLVPAAWTAYKKDALPVPDFLYTLDYFVFYQHPQAVEAFGRAILEALASGLVVILPKHFQRVFGTAAVYADVDEVQDLIRHFHSDFSIYQAQLEESRKVLNERFSYSSYRCRVENLLSEAL